VRFRGRSTGHRRFAYIGPQIEPLLGWSPQSWTAWDAPWLDYVEAVDGRLYRGKDAGRNRVVAEA
jgi:hypothetical protein